MDTRVRTTADARVLPRLRMARCEWQQTRECCCSYGWPGAYDNRHPRAAAITDGQHTRATATTAGQVYMTADGACCGGSSGAQTRAYDSRRVRAAETTDGQVHTTGDARVQS